MRVRLAANLPTDPNVLSVCHLGCSGPQFFRCHIPNNVCWLKHRVRVCNGSAVLWTRMNDLSAPPFPPPFFPHYQTTRECVLPFHLQITSPLGLLFFSFFFCLYKRIRNHRTRFLTILSENRPVWEELVLLWINMNPKSKVKCMKSRGEGTLHAGVGLELTLLKWSAVRVHTLCVFVCLYVHLWEW